MPAQLMPAGGYVLDLPINPVPQERPRTYQSTRFGSTSSRTVTPQKSRDFRAEFAMALYTQRPRPAPPGLSMPLSVTIRCWRHTRGAAGDVDNLAKAVLDAGNELLWVDDRLVRRLTVTLEDSGPNVIGRIWLRVAPLAPTRARNSTQPFTPDERYATSRARLATLVRGDLAPNVRSTLDQYGAAFLEVLANADVDVRDPIAERAVIRTVDMLLASTAPGKQDAWQYLAEIAGGFALSIELDKENVPS